MAPHVENTTYSMCVYRFYLYESLHLRVTKEHLSHQLWIGCQALVSQNDALVSVWSLGPVMKAQIKMIIYGQKLSNWLIPEPWGCPKSVSSDQDSPSSVNTVQSTANVSQETY